MVPGYFSSRQRQSRSRCSIGLCGDRADCRVCAGPDGWKVIPLANGARQELFIGTTGIQEELARR
jgi:hypothetical protein